ncbi:MAG: hypothetical protein IJT20_00145 [Synergistaceae bacterium]|nr:hypothetical protein [Synergistaceae bacterium]
MLARTQKTVYNSLDARRSTLGLCLTSITFHYITEKIISITHTDINRPSVFSWGILRPKKAEGFFV